MSPFPTAQGYAAMRTPAAVRPAIRRVGKRSPGDWFTAFPAERFRWTSFETLTLSAVCRGPLDHRELNDPSIRVIDEGCRGRPLGCHKSLLLRIPLGDVALILRRLVTNVVSHLYGISHTARLLLCHWHANPRGCG